MYEEFHLVLTVNHACNLRCTYCYTGEKFSRTMPDAIARHAIDRALHSIVAGGKLALGFFGGEPLIEAEMIDSLLEYVDRAARKKGIQLQPSLTTNGTLTGTCAWSIMTRPGLDLAVSHDGLPEIHDRHRLTVKGEPTSDRVNQTIGRLIQTGKDFAVVMVVRPDTLDLLVPGIEYLQSMGVRRIEPSIDLWAFWCQRDVRRLEQQISRCAELWRTGLPVRAIGWFDEKVPGLLGLNPPKTSRCGFGVGQGAVAPSGRLYPCERLVGEDQPGNPSCLSGHALEGGDFLQYIASPARAHEQCAECPMQHLCNTTCRCSNVVRSGDPGTPDELLCAWNQATLTATAEALGRMNPNEESYVRS